MASISMTSISMTSNLSINISLMDSFNNKVDQLISGVDKLNNSFTGIEQTLKEMCGLQSELLNKESSTTNIINQEISLTNVLSQSMQNVVNVQQQANDSVKESGGIFEKVFGLAKSGIQTIVTEAAKMQDQIISVQGMLGNKEAGKAYFDQLQKQANNSGFAFEDLQKNARNFLSITKNTDSLDKLTNLSERLSIANTSKGLEDSGSAIKNMMSGEGDSLKTDFGFNDDDIGILKASKDMDDFTAKFDELLNKKGLNADMLGTFNNSPTAQFDNLKSNIKTSFGDIGQGMLESLTPILARLNQVFTSSGFQGFINGLSQGLVWIAGLIVSLANWIEWVGTIVQSNWGIIEPIIWGIVAALLVYNASLIISNALSADGAIAMAAKTIADWAETAAIIAMTIAQDGLNAALAMCPITWIIIAIIALIVIFYVVIAAINEFAGTSYSATGIICGIFAAAGAFIGNLFIALFNGLIDVFSIIWNFIATFAEFFANVFNDPIGSIIRLFSGMASTVLQILAAIASVIDTLFGSNLASVVKGWNDSLQGLTDKVAGEAKIKVDRIDPSEMHLDRLNYGNAFNNGNSFGKGIESNGGNMFKGLGSSPDLSSWNKSHGQGDLPMNSLGNNDALTDNSAKCADRLNNMDNKIDISNEHLEMLRDLAEQDSIQNFVTLTPTVQITTGDVKEEADINKIISRIENYMENELANSAEGVYA